ncbi:hypothetical protein G6O67_003965 [Ophiocordyceps sinensis]|uniref:PUM-HD domain-containing protein n=1 Tax=Ophiocordyceps sinensis TaxID=72228 RepID=A0A8H4PNA3_9HYPO|nr:hypothetical protein G6O67_003965 [Ophiocordyceps sinensis]
MATSRHLWPRPPEGLECDQGASRTCTIPTGSNDKSQQPMGSGFPGLHLYPNKNIWTSSLSSAQERTIAPKVGRSVATIPQPAPCSPDPQIPTTSPSGSSALNANSEADVWSSNPWNTENPGRSVSTSPSRTRDGALSSASGYFDHQSSAIGMKKPNYGGKPFGDESNAYANAFTSQQRGAQDTSAYMESMAGYSHHRDGSLPPSRHSQTSPVFQDPLPRRPHSEQLDAVSAPMTSHASSFSTQSANQRAFQHEQANRRGSLTAPFQFNPGSQPWVGEGNGMRYGNCMDSPLDPLAAQYALKRSPVERLSPASTYRLEPGNSPQSYTPTSNAWPARPASRDPRPADYDRRNPAQQYAPSYTPPFFHQPVQTSVNHPMMAGYGLQAMQAGYPDGRQHAPARPSRDQDPGKGMRSALLDEFHLSNKSSKRYELKDIYNYIVDDEKEQVFREIEPNAVQLMKDVFGNYVVQKFFEHGNQVQKRVLAEKMKGKVIDLSVQVYACRVVQKALEHVLVEQQAELTMELEPKILKVTRDQNGNHVVQKIIELVPRRYIDFIMNALRGQVAGLASHTYGCRVIQRMLEYGTDADKRDIMTELHASAQILVTDQYGNYVAQHVIHNGNDEDRDRMIELVMSQLVTLSKHKYASNVVEKCIEYGTAEHRTAIRTHVHHPGRRRNHAAPADDAGSIRKLCHSKNCSTQLRDAEKEALVEDIRPLFFLLKKNGLTKQLQVLERLLGLQGGAVSIQTETAPSHADVSSTAGTPLLTNGPNSPESSSPASTRLSADGFPTEEAGKQSSGQAPKVQGEAQD